MINWVVHPAGLRQLEGRGPEGRRHATAIPMGFVRFGTGRDAADVAFAAIFGSVGTHRPTMRVPRT